MHKRWLRISVFSETALASEENNIYTVYNLPHLNVTHLFNLYDFKILRMDMKVKKNFGSMIFFTEIKLI